MWLKQLFEDVPVDFERICRTRIQIGKGFLLLGILAILVFALGGGDLPVLYLEEGAEGLGMEFYLWTGLGLAAGGLMKIVKYRRLLKNPDLKKRQEIMETDERNRAIGVRCWAYGGYVMFLLLCLGVLAGGFVSMAMVKVLMAVLGVYALLLFIFRMVLQKRM